MPVGNTIRAACLCNLYQLRLREKWGGFSGADGAGICLKINGLNWALVFDHMVTTPRYLLPGCKNLQNLICIGIYLGIHYLKQDI